MKDVKLNNNIKCCSSEQVEFGNTARDIILYKKIKELAIVVENKQDKFDFVKLINPSGNLGRDIVGKLFTNKLIELEYNGCFYSFSKADETTLTYQSLTADLNLLKIVTINIATGDYLVIEQSNEVLDDHIADQVIHVSQADRDRWNNINDGILTIQTNGTNVQTFSANQSSNVTANIIVPTKTSDLTNDSNFVISSDLAVFATKEYVDGSVASAISRVYKPQGTVTVNTLNSLTITKEMNGYVYDILGSGTLTKGSVQVAQGDNVAIIWNEDLTDWKWDRLSSIVDLSNYATKTYVNQGLNSKVDLSSDQTITGVKRFNNTVYIGNYDNDYISITNGDLSIRATNSLVLRSGNNNIIPYTNNSIDLGSSTSAYKDLYLNGKLDFGTKVSGRTNTAYITTDQYDGIGFFVNGSKIINIYDNVIYFTKSAIPSASASIDLGSNSNLFKDLYLSGNANAKTYTATNSTTNVNWGVSSNQYSNMQFERNGAPIFSMSGQAFFPNSDNQRDLGTNDLKFRDLYLSGNVSLSSANATYKLLADGAWFDIKRDNITLFQLYDTIIKSPKDNYADLGVSGNRWKNLYLAGNISDGTNSISVADITNSTFNVINATDIVNNTLTQEQYNLITNGKPTLIKGVWSSYNNLILLPPRDNSTYFEYAGFDRYKTTKIVVYSDKRITTSTAAFIQLQNIDWINGKAIPGYPSNTGTFNLKQIDGTLTWTKEWYGTQAEYDAFGTYDSNTIYNIIEE